MTCREVTDFLDNYLDGRLSADVQAEFERHLEHCPHCVDYVATYRQTVELTRVAFDPESGSAEEEVPADLVRAILAARRQL